MIKILIFLPLFLFADILSNLQTKKILLQKNKIAQESSFNKKSWLNPILLKYTITRDNALENTITTKKVFSIVLNQPIFKSGAIIYSIKYADDLKELNEKNLIFTKKKLIKTALDLAYEYKITKLNERILNLKIKNALIDVKRKKQEYKSALLDLTFLNNAIINLNSLKISLEDIKEKLANIKFNFKNISDMNIEDVKLNLFKIISLDEYINNNLELKIKKLNQKVNKDLYKMQIGDTLVTLFVNANYNYQNINYSNSLYKDDKINFYNIGAGISFPIDFKAPNKIQKAKVNYLISKYDFLQKKRELINEYKSTLISINAIKNKIKIYKNNIKLYDELINSTKEAIVAGSATQDDLIILQNSKKVNLIKIKILNLELQKKLLNLYYKLSNQK